MGETQPSLGDYTDTGNMCYAGEVKTAFATAETIDSMKAMVARADPGAVLAAGFAWEKIAKKLATGETSIKSDFDKAVEHVLQHWEGESADEFSKKAKRVSKQLSDAATYAQYTGTAMINAGNTLTDVKPAVEAIEKPSGWDKGVDAIGDGFGRSEDWSKDIQNNQGAQSALDSHGGDLSAGKEEQLKAAAQMETLAVMYSSQSQTMGSWAKRKPQRGNPDDDFPGEPGGIAPVPIPVTPGRSVPAATPAGRVGSGSSSKSSSAASPRGFRNAPGAGTKIDGISGGTATEIGRGGAGTPSVSSGAGTGAGGTSGVPNGVAGGPGMVGRASGNRGIAGAGAVGARGGAPRAGIGAGAGAAGARGMGGMGGGAGAGAGGKGSAAGGRGPLARQRGGALDTPGASKGAVKQGGSSLHSSRGGAEAGQRGRNTPGMLGGAGANTGRGREKEGRENQRPDYLVEDEETWVPKRRDVAPPTIG